ncbi:hypothetical protein TKK_0013728 [Trichogramma kaykai]|uniref:Uncharacterized protein n=1 Tax=Trichogramma kaykai TaxID=54128 RepID=A0ABD2WHE8_9HYME
MMSEPKQEHTFELTAFLQRIEKKIDGLTTHLAAIEASITRLDGRVAEQESRSMRQATEIEDIQTEIADIKSSLTSSLTSGPFGVAFAPTNTHLVDPCEILLTGLPSSVNLSHEETLGKIFKTIGLKNYHKFLVKTRPWEPKKRLKPSPGSTKAFVFQLSSPCVRDQCLINASKLSMVNTSALFGVGEHKIRLRPLWPKEVFQLLKRAHDATLSLNYAQPIVKNLTVFMREAHNSELIPIMTESDLSELKPKPLVLNCH